MIHIVHWTYVHLCGLCPCLCLVTRFSVHYLHSTKEEMEAWREFVTSSKLSMCRWGWKMNLLTGKEAQDLRPWACLASWLESLSSCSRNRRTPTSWRPAGLTTTSTESTPWLRWAMAPLLPQAPRGKAMEQSDLPTSLPALHTPLTGDQQLSSYSQDFSLIPPSLVWL